MSTVVYLASRYSRIDEMNGYADRLRALGFQVDARWLQGEHQAHDGAFEVESATDDMPDVAQAFAQDDIEDLTRADWILCFTEPPRSAHSRGGRHVEMGYALALGKRVICIGPRENVFYCLPNVERFHSFDEFTRAWEWSC